MKSCLALHTLCATNTAIDSVLLEHICLCLPAIRTMTCAGTLVSDEGVVQLAVGCPRLEHVSLADCPNVTDLGVKALVRSCPQLRRIFLPPEISDEAAMALLAGPALEMVTLGPSTRMTDAVLGAVAARSARLEWYPILRVRLTPSRKLVWLDCTELPQLTANAVASLVCLHGGDAFERSTAFFPEGAGEGHQQNDPCDEPSLNAVPEALCNVPAPIVTECSPSLRVPHPALPQESPPTREPSGSQGASRLEGRRGVTQKRLFAPIYPPPSYP